MSLVKATTPSLKSKSLGQLIAKYTELKVFDDGIEATLEVKIKSEDKIRDIVDQGNRCWSRNLIMSSGAAIAFILPILLHQVLILDVNKSVAVWIFCTGIGGFICMMGSLGDLYLPYTTTASTAILFSRKLTAELTRRFIELGNTKGNYMLDKYSVDSLTLIAHDSSGKRKVLYSQHRA